MTDKSKPVDSLQTEDLLTFPVWQYVSGEGKDETYVRPIHRTPVSSLAGKLVGTQVRLANGELVWALLGNIDPKDPQMTEHFLTVSVELEGIWFHLARYHDFDYDERGPDALAKFLRLPVDAIFPISYDVRQVMHGDLAALQGRIWKEPRERLSRSEIIAMAVP